MTGDRVPVDSDAVWPEDQMDVEEGVVVNWLAREGATVTEGQTIGVIQIEKVSIDVPAPIGGELSEIVVQEDEPFERGSTLAWVEPA